MSDDLVWADAHWSDAVISPDDANKIVVAVNLSRWGSAHTVVYDKQSGIWSQPREILPSAQDWGNLKVWVSGLSVINSRIWAVTVREPVGSGDVSMAHHVALASSTNGIDWRDEGYVATSTLRGKLLYRSDETHAYVAGNASVARATATNKLGYDNASLKYTMEEVSDLSIAHSGPGSAPELSAMAKNVDDAITDSGLLEIENELEVELGASGGSSGSYAKMLLLQSTRAQTHKEDAVAIVGTGYMSRILGGTAYRPPAAKLYDGPYNIYSRFEFDTGIARLTVRQESGTWTAERISTVGHYILACKKAGISLIPHSFISQHLIARTTFQAKVSIEGIYFVFWYEDEENYWQAGVYNDAGTQKIVIDRWQSGVKTNKASSALSAAISTGNWYGLYLETMPGRVRVYLRRSDSFDFSSTTDTTSYDCTAESSAPAGTHYPGLRVEEFEDLEGADRTGTVDASDWDSLQDDSETFTLDDVGKWVKCNSQDRRISDYDPHVIYIEPGWSDKPAVGDEYGIYPESTKDGPQAYFKELFVCEGIIPYTVDDVTNSMLELAGVSRTTSFTGTDVAIMGASSPLVGDVDVKVTSTESLAATATYLDFFCSTAETAGDAAFSGLRVRIEQGWVTLQSVVAGAATTVAKQPCMVTLPATTQSRQFRFQANKHVLIVTCDGHFVTAFPMWGQWPGGFVAKARGGDTATTTEFPEILDSFIWDANEAAASAFARLLRGRRAKVVERYDGSVSISRFDEELGVLGTYTTPMIQLDTGEDTTQLVSLIEMVGAEERAFYIDEDAARIVLRYARADNPTVESQYAAIVEAKRLADLGRQRYQPGRVKLYAPDPGLELEDKFWVDGQGYIVDSATFVLASGKADAEIIARIAPTANDGGIYDTDAYDSGKKYGD